MGMVESGHDDSACWGEVRENVEHLAKRGKFFLLARAARDHVDLRPAPGAGYTGGRKNHSARLAVLVVLVSSGLLHATARDFCQFDTLPTAGHARTNSPGRRSRGTMEMWKNKRNKSKNLKSEI